MKCQLVRRVVVITMGLCLGLFTTAKARTATQTKPSVHALKVAPSYFIPNAIPSRNGKRRPVQLLKNNPEAIAFIQTRKGKVIFTPTGAYIGMNVKIPSGRPEKSDIAKAMKAETGHPDKTTIRTVVMKTGFAANNIKEQKTPDIHLEDLTEGKVNFLIGTKANWHTNISTYRKLVYHNVWTGINVEYIGYMDRLEYRVQLEPGANPNQIVMETGAENLALNSDGSLTAELESGQLTMGTPKAWQNIAGKQVPVDVAFQPLDNGRYTFTLGAYDHCHALTIDPVLVWSTYLVDQPAEGTASDYGRAIAVDSTGAVYVTGYTKSTNFLTTPGAYQTAIGGRYDTFVTKLSADGSVLSYSTYLGGSGNDYGTGIAMDSSGAAYVT
ncbi:MAG: hypothetical protein GXO70_04725, partial [Acidobacteria bacterium]|nr:hypothetical protein [Acidobacteriota bacterium]